MSSLYFTFVCYLLQKVIWSATIQAIHSIKSCGIFRHVFSIDVKKPNISVSPSDTVNEDGNVVLKCNTIGSGDIKFQWFKNGLILPETEMFLVMNGIQRVNQGRYSCLVTDNLKSISSDEVNITVNCE